MLNFIKSIHTNWKYFFGLTFGLCFIVSTIVTSSAFAIDNNTICEQFHKNAYLGLSGLNVAEKNDLVHQVISDLGANQHKGFYKSTTSDSFHISLSKLLSYGLAIGSDTIIIDDLNELRFIPQFKMGSHLALIADNSAPLDNRKIAAVAATARRLGVRIHSIFNGKDQQSEQYLLMLSRLTGGKYLNMQTLVNSCKNAI